jgi:DNA-binding MarR family transcriptional regulator
MREYYAMHCIFYNFERSTKNIIPMKPEETVDFHIKRTWYAISRMYNDHASEYSGTMATGFVLLNIDLAEGTPATKLGPQMGMEPHSLSRTLKSMEEKGLIKRKPDPTDGRGVLINLTKEGLNKREMAKQAVLTFNERVSEELSEEEIAICIKALSVINRVIENKGIYKDD